ncbi:unnamed protein product [Porites lobata]|uniref:DMAP1-binding domain-containing protein n=1 Tax=Porites lobata TaxID=104759 RepID=A0ABN8Q736_9CNID|nr:unnamed protein product [Porites lobata]
MVHKTEPEFPPGISERLSELEEEYRDGDITEKGYVRKKCKLIKSILAKTVQERIEKIEGDFKDGKSTEEQLIKDLKELLSEIGHRATNGCDVKPRFPVHNDDIENGTAVAVNEEPMETGCEESEVEQGNVGINSGNVRSGSSPP